MSLTYNESKYAIPIAKIRGENKIIYLLPDSDDFQELPTKNVVKTTYKCPYCKVVIKAKQQFIHHLMHSCHKKMTAILNTKPSIKLNIGDKLFPLPNENNRVFFVTGAPGCGKSFFTNELVKFYKAMYPEKDVFLVTRLEHDETLKKDIGNYNVIHINQSIIDDPFRMEDFEHSLMIYDDIESSEFPKATQAMYNLLDDVCKNGRHHDISVIFCNQECRMGKKTKPILTMLTNLVIFPKSASEYQTDRLLRDYIGMTKAQITDIMSLNSRWVCISRIVPKFVLYEGGAYMIGKEIY